MRVIGQAHREWGPLRFTLGIRLPIELPNSEFSPAAKNLGAPVTGSGSRPMMGVEPFYEPQVFRREKNVWFAGKKETNRAGHTVLILSAAGKAVGFPGRIASPGARA